MTVEERFDVVVVGAGLAGLAAAATAAADLHPPGRVLCLDPRAPGGRAATLDRGGFAFNQGPRALYLGGAGAGVLGRLGVAAPGDEPPLQGAQGLFAGRLHRIPLGPEPLTGSTFLGPESQGRVGRLLASLEGRLDHRRGALQVQSVDQWLEDEGLSGAGADLVRALVRLSSYAADTDRYSADAAVHQLVEASRGVRYVDGGWSTLVRGLVAVATSRGAEMQRARVDAVEPDGDAAVVHTGERSIAATRVILAAGSPAACSALLPERPRAWTGLGPEPAAACLTLGLRRPPAVGVVVGVDRPLYCIRHAPPARLAPPGAAVLHTMRYLRSGERLAPAAVRAELEDLAALAGVGPGDVVVDQYLHRMPVAGPLPTPETGGLDGRPGVASARLRPVLVAGDWVGPALLSDAALSSGEAAGRQAAVQVGDRRAPAA